MPSARDLATPYLTRIPTAPRLLVRTSAGLEQLVHDELAERGLSVAAAARRQLVVDAADATLLRRPPRLADDVVVVAAALPDPGAARAALRDTLDRLVLDPAVLAHLRRPSALSVSASFVGRRRFSRFDVEDGVGEVLDRAGLGRYVSRRDDGRPPVGAAPWRVTLDGETVRIGLRPYAAPLHRRPRRASTVVGSLHPPVAAAMVRVAGLAPGQRVLDPCCGAGTILLEASETTSGVELIGVDVDGGAIAAATSNGQGRPIRWCRGDASRLALPSASVDRVVVNPPWGIRRSAVDLGGFLREWRRVLRPGGVLVVLLDEPQQHVLERDAGWRCDARYPVSVAGRHPRILRARPV